METEPTFPRAAVKNAMVWGAGVVFGALPLLISLAFQWIETRHIVAAEYAREVLFINISVAGVVLMNYFSADFDGRPKDSHSFTQYFIYFVNMYSIFTIVFSACLYGRYSVGGLNYGVQAEIMKVATLLLWPILGLALMFETALAWRKVGARRTGAVKVPSAIVSVHRAAPSQGGQA